MGFFDIIEIDVSVIQNSALDNFGEAFTASLIFIAVSDFHVAETL